MAALKTALFVIFVMLGVYIAIGIVKTSFYYFALYLSWRTGGRKLHATLATTEYDKDGKEVEGTKETKEIIYDSPYEVITMTLHEAVYEKLSDGCGPTLAHDLVHMPFSKIVIFLGQFVIDILVWPWLEIILCQSTAKNETRSE